MPAQHPTAGESDRLLVSTINDTTSDHLRPHDLGRPSRFVLVLAAFAAIGGFLFGYDTGIISGALLLVKDEFSLSPLQQEWVVASATAGAMLGAITGGLVNDKLGRRPSTMIGAIIFTAGSAVMGFANGFAMLLVGRIIVGCAIGLASMTVPIYIAEIAPASWRGVMVAGNIFFVTGGQFIAYLFAAALANTNQGWRIMLGVAAAPAIIQLAGMLFLPETPRYLLKTGKRSEAKAVLAKMGIEDTEAEVSFIEVNINAVVTETGEILPAEEAPWSDLITKPALRRALLVGVGLQAFQQLAGINTALYYSSTLLKMAGFNDDQTAIFFSSFVALTNMIFTVVGMALIDRVGRRKLLLTTLVGCIIGLAALGFSFYSILGFATKQNDCSSYGSCPACVLDDHCGFCSGELVTTCMAGSTEGPSSGSCSGTWNFDGACEGTEMGGWLALCSLVFYVAFFAMGMGPVPWAIVSEIYPLDVRGKASGIAAAANWTANLVVSATLLTLFGALSQAGTFWLYTSFALMAWIFVFLFMPETKGFTLEHIMRLFERGLLQVAPAKPVEASSDR